ncbi:uncharacterized protein LOC129412604 [Boleophthalmus pectinirostris]|uniref:uncharacterized protein LOC129412604 n=1 Tax=Boleophthalmus pectinirostris TaxID=150288 RepID=UPI00242EAFEF|nr:uncharacterized protein LOC129412604 [Boleophthalmus pectinirostris]
MMSLCVFRPVLLTLTLLLCSESAADQHQFVEEGQSVTLSCGDVRERQRECTGTTWTFYSVDKPGESKSLITLGVLNSSVPEISKRLRLKENCGLEIQNVHPQDAGLFYCQQYNQSGRLLSPDAPVYLSVVSLTKRTEEKNVELNCSVSSSLHDVKTKWLFKGKEVNNSGITTNNLQHGVTVTLPKSHFLYKKVDLFKCEVTDGENKKKFSFRSNKPGETRRRSQI